MMYTELFQYLIQHKQLHVPGIGTFLLERKPATTNFPERKIEAPAYSFSLQPGGSSASKKFFTWLGNVLQVSERDAVIKFNDFAFELKRQVAAGEIITWNGVGHLSKGLAGDIKFVPGEYSSVELPVAAEKVMRGKAEHMVRVGENEKTSAEMTELLNQPDEEKSYWWAYALLVAALSVIFIGWYFSENGVGLSSTSNTKKAIPEEAKLNTYRILP